MATTAANKEMADPFGSFKGDFLTTPLQPQSPTSNFTFNAKSSPFEPKLFVQSKDRTFSRSNESPRGAGTLWEHPQIFSQFLNTPSLSSPSPSDEGISDSILGSENMGQHRNGVPPVAEVRTEDEDDRILKTHLGLLNNSTSQVATTEVKAAPIFTASVLKEHKNELPHYGFIAGLSNILNKNSQSEDPRVFFNIAEPSSVFICGSQGSGKSHTLSCFLENCLMKSDVSKLSTPLAALVFHYDNFTNDARGTPCEAAHLGSNPKIKVRVLCSPTNIETTKRTYQGMNVKIEPLRINQTDLNTKRMLDLMAVSTEDGPMPLYLHSVNRILRQMRIEQQQKNSSFNYGDFKSKLRACTMTPAQLAPLHQRLDTLESFMPNSQIDVIPRTSAGSLEIANDWSISSGSLTIVDLSCPCITSEGACALFNMCLGLFLEQPTSIGRIVALDEAHKYMNATTEAATLSATLLTSIRMQRHLGARIFISTQEPTISPALLDLCSVTIVHRFTSPEWLRCLRQHLAALDQDQLEPGSELDQVFGPKQSNLREILAQIVQLRVGEALLFSPSAVTETPKNENDLFNSFEQKLSLNDQIAQKLGVGYLKIRIRDRLTVDGGKSVLAL